MRRFLINPNADECGVDCPEYAEMVADGPINEWFWYFCFTHRQWWRAIFSPDPDPETGEQEVLLEMTDRPKQILLRRLAIWEAMQP